MCSVTRRQSSRDGRAPLALRRIEVEHERALARYSRDRNVDGLERRMAEIDAEEAAIRADLGTVSADDWPEILELVRNLPALWSDPDARPEDRRELATAAFSSIDALGARRLAFSMAPPAHGVQAVVMVGARGREPTLGHSGRRYISTLGIRRNDIPN
jgi:hypothetical protein